MDPKKKKRRNTIVLTSAHYEEVLQEKVNKKVEMEIKRKIM